MYVHTCLRGGKGQRWGSYFLKVTRYLLLLPTGKNIRYSYILPRNKSNCNNIKYIIIISYITFENNSAIL